MWASRRNNPVQLGAIAVGGMLLFMLTTIAASLLFWLCGSLQDAYHLGLGGWALRLAIVVGLLVPGVVLSVRAVSILREGVRLEQWSEDEVDSLRKQVERPIWSAAVWLLLAAMAFRLVLLPQHFSLASTTVFFCWPITLLSSLRAAIRKPLPLEPKTIDWTTAKPLQSDHWGAARVECPD